MDVCKEACINVRSRKKRSMSGKSCVELIVKTSSPAGEITACALEHLHGRGTLGPVSVGVGLDRGGVCKAHPCFGVHFDCMSGVNAGAVRKKSYCCVLFNVE